MGTVAARPTVDDNVSDAVVVVTESCCSLHEPARLEALVTRCKRLRGTEYARADAVRLVVRLDLTRCVAWHAHRSADTAIDIDARRSDRTVESPPLLRRSARFEEPQQRLLEEIAVNGRYYGCRLEMVGADRNDASRALWPALRQALRT